jgi:GAF domain-containing protein
LGTAIHIRERSEAEKVAAVSRDLGYGSGFAVPLLRDGRVIGTVALAKTEPGGFDDAQVSLVESFAEHAVIAIASAQTRRELAARNEAYREQVEHQSATIDVLKVMSSSTSDTQPVFDIILRRAMQLCGGNMGALFEHDGTLVHLRAFLGVSPEAAAAHRRAFPMAPAREFVAHRSMLDGRTVYVRNIQVEPGVSETARSAGEKSVICVPLLRDGIAIGAISIAHAKIDAFTDVHIELLKTFAEQAVIAIGSVATFRELQKRTRDLTESLEQQTATADVLKAISRSAFDLDTVLDTLTRSAAKLCNASTGAIFLRDAHGFLPRFSFGHSPEFQRWRQTNPLRPGRGSTPGRVFLSHAVEQVIDIQADPEMNPNIKALSTNRTSLGVPLSREGRVDGAFVLGRTRVEAFTQRQIELVQTFADQALIAIENARLFNEVQARTKELTESLEQQTATAEVLQVINASPGHMAPVFDAILEKAHHLCRAEVGALMVYDGAGFRAAATHGHREQHTHVLHQARHPNRLEQALLDGEQVIAILDVKAMDPGDDESLRSVVERTGMRTLLMVPLRKDHSILGYITAYRAEVRPFSEKHIALLQSFAAQAVIAMENARLLTEQNEALERQTATADVLRVINASQGDIAPVFDAILEKGMRLCGAAFGVLFTFRGNEILTGALHNVPDAYAAWRVGQTDVIAPGGPVERLINARRTLHFLDLRADAAYGTDPGTTSFVDVAGARTVAVVPLLRDDVVIGLIAIFRQEVRAFSGREIALLESFAAQAVIAMENARLLTELRESLEQQTAMAEVLQVINASPGDVTPLFRNDIGKGAATVRRRFRRSVHLRWSPLLRRSQSRCAACLRRISGQHPSPPDARIDDGPHRGRRNAGPCHRRHGRGPLSIR